MIEALSTWTTEVTGWHLIMIFCTLMGAGFIGYGSGIAKGTQTVDERLRDLGIFAHPTKRLISIHEPAEDKLVLEITWDDNEVVMMQHDGGEQEWSATS